MSSFDFTPSADQTRALDLIHKWLAEPNSAPFFTLHGLAGTGKTTLVTHLVNDLDMPIYPMAYSGKAASVLTRKGLRASTIHSRIYAAPKERVEEAAVLQLELRELEKDSPSSPKITQILRKLAKLNEPEFDALRPRCWAFPASYDAKYDTQTVLSGHKESAQELLRDHQDEFPLLGGLIVLDECSMVDEKLAKDLMSFRLKILVLGDPGQLPPIKGAGYFDTNPNFVLTEIHRQALESPIIRLAMQARNRQRLKLGNYGASRVIPRRAIGKEEALGVEQILTGSNKARMKLNAEVRILKGLSKFEFPQAGERVICLRNNKPLLLNGMVLDVSANTIDIDTESHIEIPFAEFQNPIKVHRECFTRPELVKSWTLSQRRRANEFDFAYAITIHKSQGSQFRDCLIIPDFGFWDPELYSRLLYTALTRAEERVIVAL